MVEDMTPRFAPLGLDDGGAPRGDLCGQGGKAFCAGGDIRALYDWGRAKDHGKVFGSFAPSTSSTR
jgi:hypothetical protein